MPGHAKYLIDSRRDMILADMNSDLLLAEQQVEASAAVGFVAKICPRKPSATNFGISPM
jgi:hypothetical protein